MKHILILVVLSNLYLLYDNIHTNVYNNSLEVVIDSLNKELNYKQIEVNDWSNEYIKQVDKTNFWKNYKG